MVLVGVQPSFTQVPPNLSRSTTATFIPAPPRRAARAGPAWPVPTMMASKRVVMPVSLAQGPAIFMPSRTRARNAMREVYDGSRPKGKLHELPFIRRQDRARHRVDLGHRPGHRDAARAGRREHHPERFRRGG